MLQPTTWGYLGDYFSYERRGATTGWVMQAGSAALILGVPLGGLVAHYFNWRSIFTIASLLTILIAVIVLAFLPYVGGKRDDRLIENLRSLPAAIKDVYGRLVINKRIRGALYVSSLMWFGFHGLYTYLGAFLDRQFDLDTTRISLTMIGMGIGYILGGQVGGRLSDRIGRKVVVLSGMTFFAAVLSILTNLKTLSHVVIGIFAMGFGFFFTYSAHVTLLTELDPKARSTIMAANYFFAYIGLTAGSAIGGVILTTFDFPFLGLMTALAYALAGVVAFRYVFAEPSSIFYA
jgi:predicted MFS family arabinose efflux permease